MANDDARVRELVQRAGSDNEFAGRLLREPEAVANEYGLTTDQIDKIKDLVGSGAFKPAVQAHAATPDYY